MRRVMWMSCGPIGHLPTWSSPDIRMRWVTVSGPFAYARLLPSWTILSFLLPSFQYYFAKMISKKYDFPKMISQKWFRKNDLSKSYSNLSTLLQFSDCFSQCFYAFHMSESLHFSSSWTKRIRKLCYVRHARMQLSRSIRKRTRFVPGFSISMQKWRNPWKVHC